jgi:hypothetical protein
VKIRLLLVEVHSTRLFHGSLSLDVQRKLRFRMPVRLHFAKLMHVTFTALPTLLPGYTPLIRRDIISASSLPHLHHTTHHFSVWGATSYVTK